MKENYIGNRPKGLVAKICTLLALIAVCQPTYAAGGASRAVTRAINKALNFVEEYNPQLYFTIFNILITSLVLGFVIKYIAKYSKCTKDDFLLRVLSFKGAIGRIEYLLSLIALPIIYIACEILTELIMSNRVNEVMEKWIDSDEVGYYGYWLIFMFLSSVYVAYSQGAKRCHDLGHSGWFQLIPLYGLWMLLKRGTART